MLWNAYFLDIYELRKVWESYMCVCILTSTRFQMSKVKVNAMYFTLAWIPYAIMIYFRDDWSSLL